MLVPIAESLPMVVTERRVVEEQGEQAANLAVKLLEGLAYRVEARNNMVDEAVYDGLSKIMDV